MINLKFGNHFLVEYYPCCDGGFSSVWKRAVMWITYQWELHKMNLQRQLVEPVEDFSAELLSWGLQTYRQQIETTTEITSEWMEIIEKQHHQK